MSKKVKEQSSLNQIKTSTNVLFNIIFLFLGLMCIFPLLFVFSISITSEEALRSGTYQIIPQQLSNAAYMFLWNERGTILRAFCMSVLVTVVGTVITIILTTSMGYVASRRNFKLKKLYTWIIFIPMVFNGGMLASYVVVNNILNLRNTIWALILPNSVTMFYVLLMLNFFRGIPDEIEEAAVVDGAGWLTILLKIYLPLSLPSLATVTLFIIVGHWNEWFDGMIYNNHTDNYPLMTFLQYHVLNFKTSDLRPEQIAANPALADLEGRSIKSAGIVLCTLPVLVFYPFLQKYFVTGITVGSVKG